MNGPVDLAERVQDYAEFFATLTPQSLDRLVELFAPDACFKDPFNDVTGVPAIRAVFEHMYRVCPAPRFEVREWALSGQTAFIRWRFTDGPAAGRRMALDVDGMSRVMFDEAGRVVEHVDYWDPAAAIYDRIPVFGALLRALRRKLSAV
ncbi:nuclear transport factor 2 family protein [Thioalkalivibrio sulfidiphilus]|uniref:nuclear transport factor 2 family protein n=1 Tax=Thioalkalivibrio sulfidiphilus TaxID=1033854 RepID=UPI0003747A21|nr:nuclear transport factor 2 family protein [Thioalkalivibrio sulfidiphilus]